MSANFKKTVHSSIFTGVIVEIVQCMLRSPLQTSTETTEGGGSGGERQDKNIFIPRPFP